MIIQGTNRPLVIKPKGVGSISFLRVTMWDGNDDLVKAWTLNDVTIDSRGYIICPITEQESVHFYPGMVRIEITIKDDSGRKYIIPPFNEHIQERSDKEVT